MHTRYKIQMILRWWWYSNKITVHTLNFYWIRLSSFAHECFWNIENITFHKKRRGIPLNEQQYDATQKQHVSLISKHKFDQIELFSTSSPDWPPGSNDSAPPWWWLWGQRRVPGPLLTADYRPNHTWHTPGPNMAHWLPSWLYWLPRAS